MMIKIYNEWELRFLQILVDKKEYDLIECMQTVQSMKSEKVFALGDGEILDDVEFLIWYASNPLRDGYHARHSEFERIKEKYKKGKKN
jgi:hypothetical protein